MGKGLSANKLKYIAVIAMVIDHIGMVFFPISAGAPFPGMIFRIIGRLTAPIMCFFLVEGYVHTSNRKKYGIRLLCFGLISQVPYALMNYGCEVREGETRLSTIGKAFLHPDFNVILGFFFIFLMLYVYDMVPGFSRRCILIGLLLGAAMFCDWGLVGGVYALIFLSFRDDQKQKVKWFCFVTVAYLCMNILFCISAGHNWYGELWQAGLFLFVPVMYLYNGERGSKSAFHKWFFYIFYPLHMLVIWSIAFFC